LPNHITGIYNFFYHETNKKAVLFYIRLYKKNNFRKRRDLT